MKGVMCAIVATWLAALVALPAMAVDQQTKQQLQSQKPQVRSVQENSQGTAPSWTKDLACGGTAEECREKKQQPPAKRSSMRDTYNLMKGKK